MQPDYLSVVMPAFYVQEDGKWIQEQLNGLPASMRHKVATQYAEVYQAAFDAEPTPYRQQNAGRREANTRLRLYVQRYQNAAMGLTENPPWPVTMPSRLPLHRSAAISLQRGWW